MKSTDKRELIEFLKTYKPTVAEKAVLAEGSTKLSNYAGIGLAVGLGGSLYVNKRFQNTGIRSALSIMGVTAIGAYAGAMFGIAKGYAYVKENLPQDSPLKSIIEGQKNWKVQNNEPTSVWDQIRHNEKPIKAPVAQNISTVNEIENDRKVVNEDTSFSEDFEKNVKRNKYGDIME